MTEPRWHDPIAFYDRKAAQSRVYRQRPEVKAHKAAYMRAYRAAHPELRAYNREWMRRHRPSRAADTGAPIYGELHRVRCLSPRDCDCPVIRVRVKA